MSKYIKYSVIRLTEDQASAQFPALKLKQKAGVYVFHPDKKTMGPYADREEALQFIGCDIARDCELEKLADEREVSNFQA